MKRKGARPDQVGIRELRQNLSVYVKRVREEGHASITYDARLASAARTMGLTVVAPA